VTACFAFLTQPSELPIFGPLRLISMALLAMLALMIVCTPMEVHGKNFQALRNELSNLIRPLALFFKWYVGLSIGLFLLGRICPTAGKWLEWPQLTSFGDGYRFLSFLSPIGFLWALKSRAEGLSNQRKAEVIWGPRVMQKLQY
jgi:hypothetical protein